MDEGNCPAAYRFAKARHDYEEEARDSLARAQANMKRSADKGRRPAEFEVGEKVWLKRTPQIDMEEDSHQGRAQRPHS